MNLLILPSWYDTPDNPVKGLFFKEQAQALYSYFKKNNIKATITIIALQQYNIFESRLYFCKKKISISEENGITTIRARLFHIPKVEKINLKRGASLLRRLILNAEKKLGIKFSLVHIHSVQYSGLWYSLSGLRIPYLITEHSSAFFRNRITPTEREYFPTVFNNAKSILAVGKGLAEKVQVFSTKKVEVIFNIVKEIPNCDLKDIEQDKNFLFLSIGYDRYVKGFDILVKAFSQYLKKEDGYLVIGGLTDKDRDFLTTLAIECDIQNRIKMIGRIPHEEVYKLMAKSSCFVLPSRFETFGIVLAESLYIGRPVIATKTGGPDSFVTESCGIICEPGNEDELAQALISMKRNYSNYKQDEIRKYAQNSFAENVICNKLFKIYKNVIG